MRNHTVAQELCAAFTTRDMNEANTRHQIIDRLLHEVLAWPRPSVSCEEHVHPGYADYVLRDPAGRVVLLVEAKREGAYFTLPGHNAKDTCERRTLHLKTLATDPPIQAAVSQAAEYCPKLGCEYACVTNGHEFLLFRTFIRGRSYLDQQALVLPSLQYFSERFTDAYGLLGYQAVTTERSLQNAIGSRTELARELYCPKTEIAHYDAPVSKNRYACFLDPIARKYFGDIDLSDRRLMEKCFVFARGTQDIQNGMMSRLSDRLTPFLQVDGATEVSDVRKGGKLTDRIARSLQKQRSGDVVILYGGKGAGKSTFLRRLFYYDPPPAFQIHAFPIIIDCLRVEEEATALTNHIWHTLLSALDQDLLMAAPIEKLVEFYKDRFTVAKNQDLAGYEVGSMEYVRRRNDLIAHWREDLAYTSTRFRQYWAERGKGLVIALDNTDHLPPLLQDHCFLMAQHLARELSCVVIISMREERYCRARTAGVLDAYQNAGFHLAAPRLEDLFVKRLRLVTSDLGGKRGDRLDGIIPEDAPRDELRQFFFVCLRQFRDEENALRRFLQDCSRDNMRIALAFFAQFISSGYTHVEEMKATRHWTVIGHQVIKPMMIPERFNYDEDKSLIPNVFQCRTSEGSHFTMLRLLRFLRQGMLSPKDESGFWPVASLIDRFDNLYGVRGDCETCIDVMLRHGIVEANNRLDCYSVEKAATAGTGVIFADAIRITAFGIYVLEFLCGAFTYLELVSLDTGISDDSVFHDFCNAAAGERAWGTSGDKRARLVSRMERARQFMRYLKREEQRECELLLLGNDERLVADLEERLEEDLKRVRQSAGRNV